MAKLNNADADKECWSVWVNGGEVNDVLLTLAEAEELAQEFRDNGYDNVVVDKA